MRHRNSKTILDRKVGPRTALLKTMAAQCIVYERVRTTEAKAKALRPIVEKLVTKGKKGDLTARRALLAYLPTENAVKKVLEDLAPRYKERPGGYMRIIKLAPRQGDAAKMALLEFVK